MDNRSINKSGEILNWMKFVGVLVSVASVILTPMNVLAAPRIRGDMAQCEECQVERVSLSDELDLLTIVNEDGEEYRIATNTRDEKSGTRMFFWIIQSDEDLETLQQNIVSKRVNPSQQNLRGHIGLPARGWVYWNANTIRVYISPDIAADWILGFGITALLCGIVAALPLGQLPGLFCATVSGLSAGAIAFYDAKGDPGFYIVGTRDPLRVWLEP